MPDCELIALISAIACAIIKCNDEDTITILSASFTQLGDTLATYLAQKGIVDKRAQENEDKDKNNNDICGKVNNNQANNNQVNSNQECKSKDAKNINGKCDKEDVEA